ncbi:MAG: hypothetical protein AB1560_06395 [Pseudomonadota bacterium]
MKIKHSTSNHRPLLPYRHLIALAVLAALAACGKGPDTEPYKKTEHRRDFAPEEFGIGRQHTRDSACNREIDQLLDAVRVCYNTRTEAECVALQQRQADRIARLKNSLRCQR